MLGLSNTASLRSNVSCSPPGGLSILRRDFASAFSYANASQRNFRSFLHAEATPLPVSKYSRHNNNHRCRSIRDSVRTTERSRLPVPAALQFRVQKKSHNKQCLNVSHRQSAFAESGPSKVIWSGRDVRMESGVPDAGMGAVRLESGAINFALRSRNASSVHLALFSPEDFKHGKITQEISLGDRANLNPHRTDDVWHCTVYNLPLNALYAWRLSGPREDAPGSSAVHRFDSSLLMLCPYARACVSRTRFGNPTDGECWPQVIGAVSPEFADGMEPFDWEGDEPLNRPLCELVIYEMHVRGYTADESSHLRGDFPEEERGTFAGMIRRLDHLVDLGITCIELLPVAEFNELETYREIPGGPPEARAINYWGYSTINYFSPMARYAVGGGGASGAGALREFKELVKQCHNRGIEVILDVVFNHTAEGDHRGPSVSFRGIDNATYYMLGLQGEYYNYSGCGNTLDCNNPMVQDFIIACLRYWREEMHVDGFRFDLASIMTRASKKWWDVPLSKEELAAQISEKEAGNDSGTDNGEMSDTETETFSEHGNEDYHSSSRNNGIPSEESFACNPTDWDDDGIRMGDPLCEPPLIRAIATDSVLKFCKLIAEPWDCGGLYQVGTFPHWNVWSEWNGRYRDAIRRFIKGTDGSAGEFAARICGSPDVYEPAGRSPLNSINFVTAHDGFSLADLVSYNEKSNSMNGENNNDGENHNESWNCGEEGPTQSPSVLDLRQKQMRNMLVALFISQGVPMICMGDEYAHTKNGNNNTYCHDNHLNHFDWKKLDSDTSGLRNFIKGLIRLRLDHSALGLDQFPQVEDIQWHGRREYAPDWNPENRLVAFTLTPRTAGISRETPSLSQLYVAFNSSHNLEMVELPKPPDDGHWVRILDTAKPAPLDFLHEDAEYQSITMIGRLADAPCLAQFVYPMAPYSSIILRSASGVANFRNLQNGTN